MQKVPGIKNALLLSKSELYKLLYSGAIMTKYKGYILQIDTVNVAEQPLRVYNIPGIIDERYKVVGHISQGITYNKWSFVVVDISDSDITYTINHYNETTKQKRNYHLPADYFSLLE